MKDEQIEKALHEADDIAINEDVDCYDVLDYINRLKAEIAGLTGKCEALETDRDNLLRTLAEHNEEIEHTVRKETAREILRDIHQKLAIDYVDEEIGYQDECIDTACLYEDLREIAEKYGVGVDE